MKPIGKFQKILGTLGILVSLVGVAVAQTTVQPAQTTSSVSPMIYPAHGQSQEQMEKDKADAYVWAKQQSGYDPMAAGLQAQQPAGTTQQPYTQPPPQRGGVVRGGARGAVAGAVIGGIAGDAGKGAAIGAASGGTVGGVRQRRANDAQSQAVAQQQAAQQQATVQQQSIDQQKMDAYKRAFTAAMEGKGYTVQW